jgi:hypothetical protein
VGRVEVSGQLHVPAALQLGTEPQVINGWRAGWPTDMEIVERGKYLSLEETESQFLGPRARSPATAAKLVTSLFRISYFPGTGQVH